MNNNITLYIDLTKAKELAVKNVFDDLEYNFGLFFDYLPEKEIKETFETFKYPQYILNNEGIDEKIASYLQDKIQKELNSASGYSIDIECLVYDMVVKETKLWPDFKVVKNALKQADKIACEKANEAQDKKEMTEFKRKLKAAGLKIVKESKKS